MKMIFPSGLEIESEDVLDTLTWRPPKTIAPWRSSLDYPSTMWELTATKGTAKFVSYHPSMELAELSAIALVNFLKEIAHEPPNCPSSRVRDRNQGSL